ncbi:unnamed protein product [Alopecurus aequalis]
MLVNSTVELVTIWASSSPSLMAFCFSHVIIAVLLLGSRGCAPGFTGRADEHVTEASQSETPDAAPQIQGSKRNSGGHDDRLELTVIAIVGRSCAPEVHGRAEESSVEAGEVDAAVLRTRPGENIGGQDDLPIAADASSSEEKCGDEEEDDELMMRAEEFIQRMNRAWRTETVRVG